MAEPTNISQVNVVEEGTLVINNQEKVSVIQIYVKRGGVYIPYQCLPDVEQIKREWTTDDEYFVETQACITARRILDTRYHVTIAGYIGDGKTATAHHLILEKVNAGYKLIILESINQWERFVRPDEKEIVFIDNIFKTSFSKERICEFKDFINKIEKHCKLAKGNILVVMTASTTLLKEARDIMASESEHFFEASYIVDFTTKDFTLTDEEKCIIVLKCVEKYGLEENESKDYHKIAKTVCPYAFPLCANMWAKLQKESRSKGLECFESLRGVIFRDLKQMKDNDRHAFNFLTLLLFKRRIKIHEIGPEIRQILADVTLPAPLKQRFGKPILTDGEWESCVGKILGIYLKNEQDDFITFYHDIILEQMYIIFFNDYPNYSLEKFPFYFISSTVRTTTYAKGNDYGAATITGNYYEQLAKRFVDEVRYGNIAAVCSHQACQDVVFVATFTEHLFREKDLEFLLEIREQQGNTQFYGSLLFWAARYNNVALCKGLVKEYKRTAKIDKFFLKLQSSAAMIHLIRNRNFCDKDLIQGLLALGADVLCSLTTSRKSDVYMYNCNHCSLTDKEGENILQVAMGIEGQTEEQMIRFIDILQLDVRMFMESSDILPICANKGWNNLAKRFLNDIMDPNKKEKYELALWYAVKRNNVELVEILLRKGVESFQTNNKFDIHVLKECRSMQMLKLLYQHEADLFSTDDEDRNLLFYVQSPDMATFLLENGLDINKADCNSSTPLHHVQDDGVLKVMLEANANVLATDDDNYTPLHTVKSYECCRLMIEHLKNKQQRCDANGQCFKSGVFDNKSPLFICTDEKTLKEMLLHFDVKSSITQAHGTCGGGHDPRSEKRVLVSLHEKRDGALIEKQTRYLAELYDIQILPKDVYSLTQVLSYIEDQICDVKMKEDIRNRALQKACNCQCKNSDDTFCSGDIVLVLLENTANPTVSIDEGDTAIRTLCKNNCINKDFVRSTMLRFVERIYEPTSSVVPQLRYPFEEEIKYANSQNMLQSSPTSLERYSVETCCNSCINHKEKTEHNEVQEGCTTEGMTSLMYHAKEATITVPLLQLFLSHGADLMSTDVSGKTKLHYLLTPHCNNPNVVAVIQEILKLPKLELQDYLNVQDDQGNTAIHYACSCSSMVCRLQNRVKVIHLLLTNGADPSIKNKENENALHRLYRCQCGDKGPITKMLIQSSSIDLHSKNNNGETCLQTLCKIKIDSSSTLILQDTESTINLLLNEIGGIDNVNDPVIQSTTNIDIVLFILQKGYRCNEQELHTIYKTWLEKDELLNVKSWALLCKLWETENTFLPTYSFLQTLPNNDERYRLLFGDGKVGESIVDYFHRYSRIASRTLEGMKYLLRGINNVSDFTGTELWMHSIVKEKISKHTEEILRLLIEKGLQINKVSDEKETILSILLESNGDDEDVARCLRMMIEHKVDLLDGTPLISATKSRRQRTECIKLLLQHCVDVNQFDSEGKNALHHLVASFSSHHQTKWSICSTFNHLVKLQIDLFKRTIEGQSVLDLTIEKFRSNLDACALFDTGFVESLLQRMKDSHSRLGYESRNRIETSMHRFISTGKCRVNELVKKMLDIGFDPTKTDNNGRNALHCCAKQMNSSSLKTVLLLLRCSKFDINAVDKNGKSALHLFCRCSEYDSLYRMQARVHIMNYLILRGANPNLTDNNGNTVLHEVMYQLNDCLSHTKDRELRYLHVLAMMVSLLISNSADTKIQNFEQMSVLDLGNQSSEKMGLFIRQNKGVTMDLVLEHLTIEWNKTRKGNQSDSIEL